MKDRQEDDKTLSFVRRWIKAFNRIFKIFGTQNIRSNAELVGAILAEEQLTAKTSEEIETLAEKRKLLEELCEDVDKYYEKKAVADKATNLDDWFDDQVKTFAYDVIPDANQEDVKEIEDSISKSIDDEIEARATLLESEFSSEERGFENVSQENEETDE